LLQRLRHVAEDSDDDGLRHRNHHKLRRVGDDSEGAEAGAEAGDLSTCLLAALASGGGCDSQTENIGIVSEVEEAVGSKEKDRECCDISALSHQNKSTELADPDALPRQRMDDTEAENMNSGRLNIAMKLEQWPATNIFEFPACKPTSDVEQDGKQGLPGNRVMFGCNSSTPVTPAQHETCMS
jgi:hypothetical protein